MDLKNILILYNPTAGLSYPKNYQTKTLAQFKRLLPQTDFTWLETDNLNSQSDVLKFKKYDRLVVIGGDGTIKLAAQFLLKNNLDLPLAVIPQGSANVLASALDIFTTQTKAVKIACQGREKLIDVGLLNQDHYFIIGVSLGYISEVVLNTTSQLKKTLGIFAYLKTLLKPKKINQQTFNFTIDNQAQKIVGNTLLITNTFSLLSLKSKKSFDFTDGLLEIMITQNKTAFGFLPTIYAALTNNRLLTSFYLKQGRHITVAPECLKNISAQIDGEPISLDKLEAEIIPQRLKIVATA